MANPYQMEILEQGVSVWNIWRDENPDTPIDLSNAKLPSANLKDAYLTAARLTNADLSHANLDGADLSGADISKADMAETDLTGANLHGANIIDANLKEAILTAADLVDANLNKARLVEANLENADLQGTNFTNADLRFARLRRAQLGATAFGNNDLSETELESLKYFGPSTIGIDTIQKSKGKLPEKFLRGCGLSDWQIASVKLFDPSLENEEINEILYKIYDLRAGKALQISPLFISYSHADSNFVDELEKSLNNEGIRFWRDIHKATSGRLEKQIDRAIRQNPTVLLVLSSNSTKSDWVEHEVRKARELEKELNRDILCPIALDNSWKTSTWPERIMEQVKEYNILDFSRWKNLLEFNGKFNKLIQGLDLFYK